jgi:hypothetical protein
VLGNAPARRPSRLVEMANSARFFLRREKWKKSVGRCLLTARSLVFLLNRAIRPLIKKAEHHEDD